MIRIRYAISDHPASLDGKLAVEDKKFVNVPSFHHYAPVHHWIRIDPSTIFVQLTYHACTHDKINCIPGVSILPALASRKRVFQTLRDHNNHHHISVVTAFFGADEDSMTADLVDHAAIKLSPIFDHVN